MGHTGWIWGAGVVLAGWLTGCGDETLEQCDIREASCQHDVFAVVARLRGDEGAKRPPVRVISEKKYLAERVGPEVEEDEEQAFFRSARGLAMFGLLPEDLTVTDARREVADEIAAYYSTHDREVTIVDRGRPMDSRTSLRVLAHEYVHALQDTEHDLDAFRERWASDQDALLAVTALIEGEAVHYANLFDLELAGVDAFRVDWSGFYADWIEAERAQFAEDPAPYLTARYRFAYAYGGRMVQQVWEERGSRGIEALYDDPPVSTRDILSVVPRSAEERERAREQVRGRAIPAVDGSGELLIVTSLGKFLFDEFFARTLRSTGDDVVQRVPPLLEADVYSQRYEPNQDRVSAAWRLRFESGRSLLATLQRDRLRSLNDGNESVFVADEGGVPADLTALEWREAPEADQPEGEEE